MVQLKYNPKEALERVKLLMKYDSSKTLTENVKSTGVVLSEEPAEEKISMDIWRGATSAWGTDEDKIVNSILDIKSMDEYFKVNTFLKKKSRLDIVETINKEFASNDTKYVQKIATHLEKLGFKVDSGIVNVRTRNEEDKVFGNNFKITPTTASAALSVSTKTTYTPCVPGTYVRGCKSDVVKKVQVCLGQAPKHQTGNFGPITQENLRKLGKGFENGFKDADISKICNQQDEVKPEVGGEDVVKPEVGGEDVTTDPSSTNF